jgi:hypothetical protein
MSMFRIRLRAIYILASLAILLGIALSPLGPNNFRPSRDVTDVSWPNCTIRPAPSLPSGIIGVNDGLDFRPNPCLASETGWFKNYSLYMNTGYPGVAYGKKYSRYPFNCHNLAGWCLAYNWGYNAAVYAIRYAGLQNAHTTFWWFDVETDNSWTTNTGINSFSLLGAYMAVKVNVPFAKAGFYSSPQQWAAITGSWHNNLPSWLATGSLEESLAANACQDKSFTGGPVLLTQYTAGLDKNVMCSGDDVSYGLSRFTF